MKLSNLSQNSNQNNIDEMNKTEKYWQEFKKENYNESFPAFENWVENRANSLNREAQNYKLNKTKSMKNFFAFNKFKLVYAFLLLAVVFAACSMPVTQNETVAYGVKLRIAKDNEKGISQINNLSWIDKSHLTFQEVEGTDKSFLDYNLVVNAKSEDEMKFYLREIDKIEGLITANHFPLNQTTKRPLYAAALHSFFRFDIDATNRNDKDVEAELQKQLKDAGIDNIQVSYKKNSNGDRMLEMTNTGNHGEGVQNFELGITDGNNKQFIKTRSDNNPDMNFEGKSDDEVRKIIAENLAADGITVNPADIKIERDDKGKVKVTLEKTETGKDRVTKDHLEIKIK